MRKVVIVGAGYAGMMAAHHLEKLKVPFTLINKFDYHYLTTLLHEAAGGRSEPRNYAIPIKQVLTQSTSEVVIDEISGIVRDRHVVVGNHGEYEYDYLIYALGWVSEYFGIPGMKENSLSIVNLESAMHIRNHIEQEFSAYTVDHSLHHLRIVVGGAGLTGIEFVGELLEWIPELCIKLGIDKSLVSLQCVEAMPSILPQIPESLRAVAMDYLTEKGAWLRVNTKLNSVDPGVVHLGEGEQVEAGSIIWTGGVRANPLLSESGFTVDRRGRAKVTPMLQSEDDDRIFIAGDSAWCELEAGKPLPPTAQIASQMGALVAKNIDATLNDRPLQVFEPSLKGTLASLGSAVGVGDMMGIPVKGLVAGMAKEATKVKYLLELGGVRLAADKSGQLVQL
jgi:NADH:ubiquinone reductase (H+-translocating)